MKFAAGWGDMFIRGAAFVASPHPVAHHAEPVLGRREAPIRVRDARRPSPSRGG
jgi:hypothetical protein